MVVDGDRVLHRCVVSLLLALTGTSMATMFFLACRPGSTLIWSPELTSVAIMCCSMHVVLRGASKFSYTPISWKTTLIRDVIQTKCPNLQMALLWKSTRTTEHLHAVFILGLMTFVVLTLLSPVLTDSRIKWIRSIEHVFCLFSGGMRAETCIWRVPAIWNKNYKSRTNNLEKINE